MADFLEIVVSAAASGSIYGLVALSYLLVLRPTGVINFAVGEWAMLGAFAGYSLGTALELPYVVALPLTIAVMAVIGWITDRVSVRPFQVRGAPILAPILALLGMLVVFREIASLTFGADQHPLPYPFGFGRLELGPIAGTPQAFYMIAATLAVFVLAWLFFERTLWGRAFEAVALNRRAAALMGINLRLVSTLAFAGGAAVAGFAGLLIGPDTGAHYLMGLPLAVQGFSALVIGGVGRVEGALLGGLVLAFAEQLTQRYAPIPSGFTLAVPLILLILFLLMRPTGLLRAREAR